LYTGQILSQIFGNLKLLKHYLKERSPSGGDTKTKERICTQKGEVKKRKTLLCPISGVSLTQENSDCVDMPYGDLEKSFIGTVQFAFGLIMFRKRVTAPSPIFFMS